ncbi:MAG: DNA cytosine methyltransferase [Luteolibacter sp.]|jgi:DNA (cytosine-5)-methyltransferase 1|nr:DNA cytosine methyltransferase [Luteolibacter sp.]
MTLKTIDLFAGAGGITEGFRQAGSACLFANDFNPYACETFRLNHPGVEMICGAIQDLDASAIRKSLAIRKGELDVLVAGPPCQGFSINAPERFLEDPRNSLFKHYLRFVDEFAPKTFLFENVPGMLSLGGGRIFDTILSQMRERGYRVSARILLAAHYGVPQVRWRMIILGSQLGEAPAHPKPSHYYDCRPNFKGGATIATRLVPFDQLSLKTAVTLADAISDLPPVEAGGGEEVMAYGKRTPKSSYGESMREGSRVLYNHTANRLSKINFDRLAHIAPGSAWTSIPHALLPAGMKKARTSDHTMRYGRLSWQSLAGTMMTKCDPHWGAVFHPGQDRTFTVRETARIQSFPDSYRFLGPRAAQYEQVGNAVPVLLAKAIANSLAKHLAATTPEARCL